MLCFQNINNRQLENTIPCEISPVHDGVSDKLMDDAEHYLEHKDTTVIVNNDHYVVAASGKFN